METEIVTADVPFLLVRRDMIGMLESHFIDLEVASWVDADTYVVRDDGRRLQNWERSVPSQIGLAVAARYALRVGIDAIEARVKALGALRRREFAKRPGISVHDLGVEQWGIVTFLKDGEAPHKTRDRLRALNINVHVSRSPRAPALDLPAPRLDALVRVVAGWTPRYDPADDIAMRTVRSIVPVGRPRQRIQGAAAIKTVSRPTPAAALAPWRPLRFLIWARPGWRRWPFMPTSPSQATKFDWKRPAKSPRRT